MRVFDVLQRFAWVERSHDEGAAQRAALSSASTYGQNSTLARAVDGLIANTKSRITAGACATGDECV
jgi:hypothetical protein